MFKSKSRHRYLVLKNAGGPAVPVSIVAIAILPHPARAENERPVSEEKKSASYIFFEPERITNDLNTRETALTKYNLKHDSSDYDYDLQKK